MSRKGAARFVPFAYGFRPFFFFAGVYAAAALGTWLWIYRSGSMPLGQMPPQLWHGHEMLYGFVAAAIAGFMLTAVPSWTGSRGYAGGPLKLLVLIWLAGRMSFMFADRLPFALFAVLELAFIPALIVTIAPSLLRTFNRNTPLLLVLLLFWSGDLLFVFGVTATDVAMSSRGLRVGLDLVLVLITVIGGRIVPAFTRNALRERGTTVNMRGNALLEKFTIGTMLAYAIADIVSPYNQLTAVIAVLAGLAQLARLVGWHGIRTASMPIVWVLHVAYLWMPIGLLLQALFVLGEFSFAAYWQHALGAGVAGTMILAVMTRASLGHTARPIVAHWSIALAYVLLVFAISVRVFGPSVLTLPYQDTVVLAGLLWCVAFVIFALVYAPVLLMARLDGKSG